jgi:hypothetical protein
MHLLSKLLYKLYFLFKKIYKTLIAEKEKIKRIKNELQ